MKTPPIGVQHSVSGGIPYPPYRKTGKKVSLIERDSGVPANVAMFAEDGEPENSGLTFRAFRAVPLMAVGGRS